MSSARFDGWAPIRVYWQGAEPFVDWCFLGANRFTHPFFDSTIHFALQLPFNSLFRRQTPLAALAAWHAESPGLKPAGFVFHMSRCGSTLVSQLLASLPRNLVLSEPGPIDSLARAHLRAPQASLAKRITWFQWMVSALGQRWSGQEQNYFIKFDSRTTLELPLIRQAFPDVPWIFLYRDPLDVMVSWLRNPSMSPVPGISGPPDEYAARVLGRFCEAAIEHFDQAGMLVNYSQLPDFAWTELPRHFGIALSSEDIDRMRHAAAFNSKRPDRKFESVAEDSSDRVLMLAEQWIMPHYRRLEELRDDR